MFLVMIRCSCVLGPLMVRWTGLGNLFVVGLRCIWLLQCLPLVPRLCSMMVPLCMFMWNMILAL